MTRMAEALGPASSPAAIRRAIRSGRHVGPTSGLASGYVQGNLVVLPAQHAQDFAIYCERNPRPCPLLAISGLGDPGLPTLAEDFDVRTDLPRYRVYRDGRLVDEPVAVSDLWRDDLVTFVLGCSFTFEQALAAARLPLRHVEMGGRVSMLVRNIDTTPAGPFAGRMVVSMRPLMPADAERAAAITARFPLAHGEPVHYGDPQAIGIADLGQPDFGDPVALHEGEMPVFWACGVTPQVALERAALPFCITHSPGCMVVSDLLSSELDTG